MRYLIAAVLCLCATSAHAEAVFPTAVSEKYANEKPDKARQRTCLDQYMTNKTTNGNDGLVWQHKGAGYWSECNKRLGGTTKKKSRWVSPCPRRVRGRADAGASALPNIITP